MKLLKNLIYQFVMFNLMIFINKYMIMFIDIIYLFSLWSMISVWVLSESFILNSDMKYLENNNKDLSIKYNLLLSDYNKVLIDRYNQINLICETLAKNNILIAELNNDINYLIDEYKKQSNSINSINSINSDKSIKIISSLKSHSFSTSHEYTSNIKNTLFNKSCVF